MHSKDDLFATIDLGSNSFRLLIAKVRKDGTIAPIDEIKEVVRLASGLSNDNIVHADAIERAVSALTRFKERLRGFTADKVRVVATSTFRIASNSKQIVEMVFQTLGFAIEVISGVEEARLIYLGAMHSIAYSSQRRLVIDIGGGSTEFIIGIGYDPEIMESVTMGCVSYSERYFTDGVLAFANFENAIFAARSKIQVMEHLFAKRNWDNVIGTSGSAKSFYEICLSNKIANSITLPALYQLRSMLIQCGKISAINLVGLKEERKEVIAGGLAIMIAIMEELAISEIYVADGALREGVMYDLIGRSTVNDLRSVTVHGLKHRYEIDLVQGFRVASVAKFIYSKIINSYNQITNFVEDLKHLSWACELYEIGLSISHNDYHKHGAYILANADLGGFSKPEQMILADLVRCHRGNLEKAINSVSRRRTVINNFLYMVLAIRVSVILNRNRKDLTCEFTLEVDTGKTNEFTFIFSKELLENNALTGYSMSEELHVWQVLGFNIRIAPMN